MIKPTGVGWAGHVARLWEKIIAYRVLVVKPEGKILSGKPKRRWKDNIEMRLRETGVGRV